MKKLLTLMFALALSVSLSSFALAQDKMDHDKMDKKEDKMEKKEKKQHSQQAADTGAALSRTGAFGTKPLIKKDSTIQSGCTPTYTHTHAHTTHIRRLHSSDHLTHANGVLCSSSRAAARALCFPFSDRAPRPACRVGFFAALYHHHHTVDPPWEWW